jgi:4-oxalocrotonate tautomerase
VPTIRVELFEGRSVDQKAALAQALTEATVRTLGGSPDGVDILFYDIKKQAREPAADRQIKREPSPSFEFSGRRRRSAGMNG